MRALSAILLILPFAGCAQEEVLAASEACLDYAFTADRSGIRPGERARFDVRVENCGAAFRYRPGCPDLQPRFKVPGHGDQWVAGQGAGTHPPVCAAVIVERRFARGEVAEGSWTWNGTLDPYYGSTEVPPGEYAFTSSFAGHSRAVHVRVLD